MDFMKNISRAECQFLDSLSQADKDAFDAWIIAEQQKRSEYLDMPQLGRALNLGRDAVAALPLPFRYPRRKTARGMRAVKSCHRDDLRDFLCNLNSDFRDFDPFVEQLLKPSETTDKSAAFVMLNSKVRRYRRTASKPVSELLMEP